MKKIIGFLSLITAFTITACTDKTEEVKTEVVTVPAPPVVVVKERPVVVIKDTPQKSTTVTFDKNGVKVVTKKN
ncbi:MAG: hypothetical protein V4722_16550 [Bacteroidota bacterium]